MPLERGDEVRSKVPDDRGLLDGKVADARGDAVLLPLELGTAVVPLEYGLLTADSLSLGTLLVAGLV